MDETKNLTGDGKKKSIPAIFKSKEGRFFIKTKKKKVFLPKGLTIAEAKAFVRSHVSISKKKKTKPTESTSKAIAKVTIIQPVKRIVKRSVKRPVKPFVSQPPVIISRTEPTNPIPIPSYVIERLSELEKKIKEPQMQPIHLLLDNLKQNINEIQKNIKGESKQRQDLEEVAIGGIASVQEKQFEMDEELKQKEPIVEGRVLTRPTGSTRSTRTRNIGEVKQEQKAILRDIKHQVKTSKSPVRRSLRLLEQKDKPFQKGVGDSKGLFSDQIEQMMKKYPPFIGVIASDQILDLVKSAPKEQRFGFIMNLDPSSRPGSHWVSIAVNPTDERPDPYSIMYFDPLGDPPRSKTIEDLKMLSDKISPEHMLKFKVNHIQHQNDRSDTCGYHSMNFLINIFNRKSFIEATGFDRRTKDQSVKYENEIKKLRQTGFGFINLMGSGIIDKVKEIGNRVVAFIKGRKPGSPEYVKFMQKHGQETINSISVCREPVQSWITKALNLLTLGDFAQRIKALSYDKLYHLYLVFTTSSGTYLTERNEIVRVQKGGRKGDCVAVPIKNISVGQFLGTPLMRVGEEKFFTYSINNNCQDYISLLLRTSGMMTPDLNKFINQDIPALLKDHPLVKKFAETITGFAGRLQILRGLGRSRRTDPRVDLLERGLSNPTSVITDPTSFL
jgi:hypothetical protein